MAAITGDFAPGPYSMTWNGNACGLMEGSIRHQQQVISQPIRASLYGQTVIDHILQGAQHVAVFVVKEWNTNVKAVMWPFGASHGVVNEAGLLFSSLFKQMVLTALDNTPAATEGPVTRTYPLSGLLPGHNLDITFGPEERNVPVALAILPEAYSASSSDKKCRFFTDT